MPFITWDESFSIGVPQIDGQHQRLVELINEIHSARTQGKTKEVIRHALFELYKYSTYHFSDEKRLMRELGYDFHRHCGEHESFIVRIDQLSKGVLGTEESTGGKAFKFLVDWLLDHILTEDKKIGLFIQAGSG